MRRNIQTMVTVLRPGAQKSRAGVYPMTEYIDVPRLSMHGEWCILDMLTDESALNVMRVYNRLNKDTRAV